MRLMIATPAHGGTFCWNYVMSLVNTVEGLTRDDIHLNLYTMVSEALISRARNTCATAAMEWGADKLMFIDADIGWKYEDLKALLRSDKMLVGGTYPMKTLPLSLNYNVFPEHGHLFSGNRKSLEDHTKLRQLADPVTGEIAVKHIPTGFMAIDIKVLHLLKDKVPSFIEKKPNVPPKTHYDLFPIRVRDGILESEDWAFCTLCRENGIDIHLNTKVIVNHMGNYIYQA